MFYNRRVPLERLFVVCVRSIAQPGRALRSGRRGRRFESCYSDHEFKPLVYPAVLIYHTNTTC